MNHRLTAGPLAFEWIARRRRRRRMNPGMPMRASSPIQTNNLSKMSISTPVPMLAARNENPIQTHHGHPLGLRGRWTCLCDFRGA